MPAAGRQTSRNRLDGPPRRVNKRRMSGRIRTEDDLAAHLAALVAADRRLAPVAAAVPAVPLRNLGSGLAGLLRIVVGQQLSTHAAAAVWQRLQAAVEPLSGAALAAADDLALRGAGLSRQKVRTVRAIVAAERDGLDLEGLCEADVDEARAALVAVPGVGPWTAELYLMFCAGAPDLLPGGDLALRKAAGRALGLDETPTAAELEALGRDWAPHRSTAARLLWAFYRAPPAASPRPEPAAARPAGFPV